MNPIHTTSIILQKVQTKDFKYIVKLYTEKRGLLSAEIEIKHHLQPSYILPPNINDVVLLQNKYKKIYIKDIQPNYIFKHLYSDYKKNIISQFILEILLKSIKEEYADKNTFQFILNTFKTLDCIEESSTPTFHLQFLKQYIQISGYYPVDNFSSTNEYFDLKHGRFSSHPSNTTLSADDSKTLYSFLFDNNNIQNTPILRLTHIILDYIKIHLSITDIQSLPFLKEGIILLEF